MRSRAIGVAASAGAALILLCTPPAGAQDRVAQITAAKGSVTVVRAADGTTDEAKQVGPRVRNGSVFAQDVVSTGAGSEATVVFADGSSVSLAEATSLAIREGTEVDAAGRTTTTGRTIKVLAGRIAAEIIPGGAVATEFETPTGVAAVKGTALVIEVGGEVAP